MYPFSNCRPDCGPDGIPYRDSNCNSFEFSNAKPSNIFAHVSADKIAHPEPNGSSIEFSNAKSSNGKPYG